MSAVAGIDWSKDADRADSLGAALCTDGFAIVRKHGVDPDTVTAHHDALHAMFTRITQDRLKAFEFLSLHGIERGYVPNPSGGMKPNRVDLSQGGRDMVVTGVVLRFVPEEQKIYASRNGQSQVHAFPADSIDIDIDRRVLKIVKNTDGTYAVHGADDKRSWITAEGDNIFPGEAPAFQRANMNLYGALRPFTQEAVAQIGAFLEKGTGARLTFNAMAGTQTMRSYQYPPLSARDYDALSDKAEIIRVGPHQDFSFITVLPPSSDAGLQVEDANGNWRDVAVAPDEVVVMAGQILNYMTKGIERAGAVKEIPSIRHRVVGDKHTMRRARYSTPVFVSPSMTSRVLSLKTGQPVRVQDKSGVDVAMDPALRLLHAHLKASTRFAGVPFDDYLESHMQTGETVRRLAARDPGARIVHVP